MQSIEPATGEAQTPNVPLVLSWQRWRRGGGEFCTHPLLGSNTYSLNPIRTTSGRNTGRYTLTDFSYRSGRTAEVTSLAAGKVLAAQWAGEGAPEDGHARLRAAWGAWHEQVPAGHVGVYVQMPGGGHAPTFESRLVSATDFEVCKSDLERRLPVEVLLGAFDHEATTKQV